ncbi:tetratricopeptide repeat protein [Bythopirellula polymerisocia]|uniref:Uncharacterized protein n=1 Tax=Bythopirellula polymerisocia TaxID=2528003 RepID=A0A5C6CNY1_9BACT|nr:tetratricopeptide repeat protein [Bythopirellula polymerisocia]TWU25805.1 hypothetical protein Pla144_30170 [Bythopirellula polymerisocia]
MFRNLGQRIAGLGAAMVWPVEKFFGWLFGSVLNFTDYFERIEGLFFAVGRGLLWPFRMVGRLMPSSVARLLSLPFVLIGRLFAGVGNQILRVVEYFNLDGVVLWLVWLTQPIWRPFAALGGFLHAWFVTRNWRHLVWGLPALVMLLPFAIVLGAAAWNGQGKVVGRYQTAVREALEAKDYERAQLYERKLAQLGVDTQLTAYRTALALAEEDKLEEAYERMLVLAPTDHPGYPAAHFWIIQRLFNGDLVESREEARALVKTHLDHLESLGIQGASVQLMRAMWLAQGGQLAEAVEELEPLVHVMPAAAFERMRMNLQLKQTSAARQDARSLITQMNSLVQRGSSLEATELQWWFTAEEILGNWDQMGTILAQWRKLEPENEQIRQASAGVARQQADKILRSPLPDMDKVAELLLDAEELDPNPEAMQQLAAGLFRAESQNPDVAKLLTTLGESPRVPAELLVLLGTEAAIRERYSEAQKFLAAALEKDDSNPIAWNNYGLVLADGDDPDLEKALKAVNRSLEMSPQEYRFRETRGQILLKLGQWEAAIDDLEFALNGMPDLAVIHQSLATAYDALGNSELAELHREAGR